MAEKNTLETVLKWIVLVILAVLALKVVATILGLAFVIGGFLVFKVLPLVLLVWIVLKIVEWLLGRNGGPRPADAEF